MTPGFLEYGKASGLLDDEGNAKDPSRAQTAWNAWEAAEKADRQYRAVVCEAHERAMSAFTSFLQSNA